MLSEAEIIKGCLKNSSSAQKMLYTRYSGVLYSVCLRYIKEREEAKDVLHDSFLKIFDKIGKYKGEGSFEGWLKRIVIHMCIDYIKKKKRITFSSTPVENVDKEEEKEANFGSDQLLNSGFSANDLLPILHRIPLQYGTVFNMFYIDNLSHKEISESQEIDENTSRTRLHRAKALLKRELEIELLKRQRSQLI